MLTTRSRSAGSIVLAFGIHRPPAAAAGVGDQHIHPAPLFDDAGDHGLDREVIADIAFDAQRGAARCLDFGDSALRGHILRLGIELPIGFQIEIGDLDLCAEPGQTPGVGAAEPARRAGNNRNLAVELAHQRFLPVTGVAYSAVTDIESEMTQKFREPPTSAVSYGRLSAADH